MLTSIFFSLPPTAPLVRTALYLHIAAGGTALLSGLIPMLGRKGGALHKAAGRVYVYCMIAVAVTALCLCTLQPLTDARLFLTGIAFLAFYLSYSGWRAAVRRSPVLLGSDKMLAVGTLAVGVAMIVIGLWRSEILFTFFGSLMSVFAGQDTRTAFAPPVPGARPEPWIFRHFARLGGAYIATFTAFLVVNMGRFMPESAPAWANTIGWILPSIIGSILIRQTVRAYKVKMKLA